MLKSYSIGDLVDKPEVLPCTAPHFQWKKEVSFDEKEGALSIVTLENKEYIFDIYSGEIRDTSGEKHEEKGGIINN